MTIFFTVIQGRNKVTLSPDQMINAVKILKQKREKNIIGNEIFEIGFVIDYFGDDVKETEYQDRNYDTPGARELMEKLTKQLES